MKDSTVEMRGGGGAMVREREDGLRWLLHIV